MLIAAAATRATEAERAAVLAYWGQDPEAQLATELAVGCAVTIGERKAGGPARRVPDTQLAGRVAYVMGCVRSSVQCTITQAALVVNKAPEVVGIEQSALALSIVNLKILAPRADITRMIMVVRLRLVIIIALFESA